MMATAKVLLLALGFLGHPLQSDPDARWDRPAPTGYILPVGLACKDLGTLRKIVRFSQRSGQQADRMPPRCGQIGLDILLERHLRPVEKYALVENIPNLLTDVLIFKIVARGRTLGYVAAVRVVSFGNAI